MANTSHHLPIGQLLGRALVRFRRDLYRHATTSGYEDVRAAHLQVFGAIDWGGTRLSDLAARADMTPPAMAELVDELSAAGYLERRPDPSDGRAKLIRPTRKGRRTIAAALRAVQDIQRVYAEELGSERWAVLVDGLAILGMSQRPELQARGREAAPGEVDHSDTRQGEKRASTEAVESME